MMILKKPYAFLIRHFKLTHMIMCVFLVYIAYKCNDLLYYFTQYINAGYYIKIGDVVSEYINAYLYISLFIALAIDLSILVLLHVKEKNNTIYGIVFVTYIIVTALVINGHLNLLNMQLEIIDFKKVRLFKDVLFVSMFVQYATIIFMLIRGLGFNVKKFNFEDELEKIEISSSDNAEFEFTVELNTNTFARKLRKQRRHLKYFFVEHKRLLILIGVLIVLLSTSIAFINIGTNKFTYKENITIKINRNTIVVNNSYITNKSYNKTIISKDYTYLIVNFDVKNTSEGTNSLDADRFSLIIGNKIYQPSKNEIDSFFDFGEVYNGEKLKPNVAKNYILIFKIPNKEINSKKYIFRYSAIQNKNNQNTNKDFNIKLDPKLESVEQEIDTKKIGEVLNLELSILGETKIKINTFEIENSFNSTYDYCINKLCTKMTTKIIPNNLMNGVRTVLKLNTEVNYDKKITSKEILNKSELISNISEITYVYDGKTYTDKAIANLTPNELSSGNDIYLEVDSKIKTATQILLKLNIRGNIYTYTLLE